MSDQITTKPFVSQAQAGFAFATGQPWARRWGKETGPYKKLPKRVRRKDAPCMDCVLASLKAERLAPGVSRIRGDLCNVHGRWGSCRAAGYGSASSPRVAPKQLPKAPTAHARRGGGKGRAAAKPKPTPEQRAAEQEQKRQAREAEQQQRREETARARRVERDRILTESGLDANLQGALIDARDGNTIAPMNGQRLAAMGLAERAQDGPYRLTASGREVVNAATAGDAGRVRDTLSTARDRAARSAEQKKPTGSGGGKKKREPVQAKPVLPGTSSSRPSPRQGATLPKAPKAPTPNKPAAPASGRPTPQGRTSTQEVPGELTAAMYDLARGLQLDPTTAAAVERYGLAHRRRDGRWVLTAAGRRAAREYTPAATKAAGHTGVMVALYPDAAARRAIARADGVTEDAEQLHLTLCYLGKVTERPLVSNKDRLVKAIAQWSTAHGKPLHGVINGVGRFSTTEDDGTNAVYVAPDVPGLAETRQSLIAAIEAAGFDYGQDHDFTPHITVAYVPSDAPTPPIQVETPISFDHVTLAWGDEHHDTWLGYPDQSQFAGHTMEDWDDTKPDSFYKAKTFAVFKDTAGAYRWIARTTTAYRDRDGEIISSAALEDDAARMTATGMYGPLRYWHVGNPDPLDPVAPWGPGLDIGDCDFSIVIGRTSIESGTFKSAELGDAFAATADAHEISPGFFHAVGEPDAAGVFHTTRRFERSTVPTKHGRASNLFTGLTVKEFRMDQQTYDARVKAYLDFARDHGVPPDVAAQPIAAMQQSDKDATTRQIAYKEQKRDIGDIWRAFLTDDEPAPAVATKDAATPAAQPPAAETTATPAAESAAGDDPIVLLTAELKSLRAEVAALKAAPQDGDGAMAEEVALAEAGDGAEMGAAAENEDAGGEDDLTLSRGDLMAIGQAVAASLEPLIGALGITTKLDGHLGELKSMLSGYTKTKDDTAAQQAQELASLKTQVAELTGDAPRGIGYRASAAPETVVPALLAAAKDGPDGAGVDAGPFADQLAHWFPHLAQPGQR